MTTETSNELPKVEYEYEVWQNGVLQAGGREADYASAQSEADHYAKMYAHDGPVEVRIYEKRLLSADKVEHKRRRYDPHGSLSEYGIFPECDAQPLEEDKSEGDPPSSREAAPMADIERLPCGVEHELRADATIIRGWIDVANGPINRKALADRLDRYARAVAAQSAEVEALRAEVAALREGAWQPIETAPKDGNEVILFDPDYLQRSGFEGRYSESRGTWLSSYDGPVNPTHWMPLPPPPQDEGSGYWPEVPKNGGPDWTWFDG